MRRILHIAVFLISTLTGACESRDPAGSLRQSTLGSSDPKPDSSVPEKAVPGGNAAAADQQAWARMTECAAQADRLVSREGLTAANGVLGVQNHYSAKFSRCFMQTTMRNAEAEKNRDLPTFYYELWDAFEQKQLAVCTDLPATGNGVFCSIMDKENFRNCDVCRAFVKERMTQ